MMRRRALSIILLLATAVQAQTPIASPLRVVRGVVFDSIANAPLAGAVVQVAVADSSQRIFSGIADASGRFRIAGLPEGRFAIGFQHDALYALGLESPLRAFQIANDTSITVDLAIPSGPSVNAQLCGNVARDKRDGMLAGYVSDARSQRLLAGAVVLVQWLEMTLEKGSVHTEPHRSTAPVDAEGHYVACALATDAPIGVQVTMPGFRAMDAQISVPVGGVARRDFRLADSAASRGSSTLVGSVIHPDGSPINTGRIVIAALMLQAPVVNGAFTIPDVPAGTWEVEVLAIGFEPHTVLVDAADQVTVATIITLSRRARILDAVTVFGRPTGDLKIVEDIKRRSRTSFGSVFLAGDPSLRAALYPTDVLRSARGFGYVNADSVLARGCRSVSKGQTIAVYVDGLRFTAGIDQLRNVVPIRDLLAVEAYPDLASMPLQWRKDDTCAVIALWTKR
ncbi:MAG: carboxypeptidase regulatory-like domain-containing protein [Gemmatimonadaceae bacterium]